MSLILDTKIPEYRFFDLFEADQIFLDIAHHVRQVDAEYDVLVAQGSIQGLVVILDPLDQLVRKVPLGRDQASGVGMIQPVGEILQHL